MYQYLKGFEILPGMIHPTAKVIESVNAGLGKKAAIRCLDVKTYEDLIFAQILICFNKKLELIDCNVINDDGVFGECPSTGTVFYPRDERSFRVIEKVSK